MAVSDVIREGDRIEIKVEHQGKEKTEVKEQEAKEEASLEPPKKKEEEHKPETAQIVVMANKKPVVMRGKSKYVFVDIFDYIEFDLSKPQGAIVTNLNGAPAQFMEELHDGDVLEIYWKSILEGER